MKTYKEHFDNGVIKLEGFIDEKGNQGIWKYYFNSGIKWKELSYKDNVRNGLSTIWHENGNLYIQSNYVDGVLDGVWKEYYEDGMPKEVSEYKDGAIWPKDFWDEHGVQLLKDGNGKKIEKFGPLELDVYEQFFENGKFVKEVKISSIRYGSFTPDKDTE